MILALGINHVSKKVIESYVVEKLTKADAALVREATGFAIGSIPPPITMTGSTYQQQVDNTLATLEQNLVYYSAVLFESWDTISQITKKFSLYKAV